jgi:hypothetical protein
MQIMKQIIDNKNTQMMKRMTGIVLAAIFSLNMLMATNGDELYSKKTETTTGTNSGNMGIYSGNLRAGGDGSGNVDDINGGNGDDDGIGDYNDGGKVETAPIGDAFPFLLVLTAVYGIYKCRKNNYKFKITNK